MDRNVTPAWCTLGMTDFFELAVEAESKHGLLTTTDLLRAGVGDRQARRWVRSGRLVRVARGVYRVAGCPPSVESEILTSVLVHGHQTFASHRTAAWLWGLPGFGVPGRIEVIRSQDRSNERTAARVHRSTELPEHHVTSRRAIPVTSLPRTLFDIAGHVGFGTFDRALEAGLRTAHCTVGSLHRILAELGRRGRRGTAAMRRALEPRSHDYVPTESELDLLGRAVLEPIGGFDWQVAMSDRQGYIRRVDGLHRPTGLVIEWDGAEFHDTLQQQELDRAGDLRLRALGCDVLRFRWADVTERPAAVRRQVLESMSPEARSA